MIYSTLLSWMIMLLTCIWLDNVLLYWLTIVVVFFLFMVLEVVVQMCHFFTWIDLFCISLEVYPILMEVHFIMMDLLVHQLLFQPFKANISHLRTFLILHWKFFWHILKGQNLEFCKIIHFPRIISNMYFSHHANHCPFTGIYHQAIHYS